MSAAAEADRIRAALAEARRGLLDLSTRNRLLSLPKPGRSRGVVALSPQPPGPLLAELLAGRPHAIAPEEEPPAPPRPGTLRAAFGEAELTRRLRNLDQDARTAREETGVSTLFLAFGALAWRDPATPGIERLAPLVLLPVALSRTSVRQAWRLAATGEEPGENLSLREKLATEFALALPPFDADADIESWLGAVAAEVAGREGFALRPDALHLGLFSFAKFLMWRDLDPAAHPGIEGKPLVARFLGAAGAPGLPAFPDGTDVDAEIPPERADHVIELDGSQALAVEAVRRGADLVIQGPPGTGKSQVITAIIAQAVMDGKRVLFVAEKLAALEVVQRRLARVGLGAACLELHSEKPSRRAVLDELRATLALPPPPRPDRGPVVRRLAALRERLNGHAAAMARPVAGTGVELWRAVGVLAARRAKGAASPGIALDISGWDPVRLAEARSRVRDLAQRAAEGAPRSPWRGVRKALGIAEQERLLAALPGWIRAFSAAAAALPAGAGPAAAAAALEARALRAAAPEHDPAAMADPAWQGDLSALEGVVSALASLRVVLADPRVRPGALDVPGVEEARRNLGAGGLFGMFSAARRQAQAVAARVTSAADPLPVLDIVLAGQAARRRLRAGEALAARAFGRLWQGERSDPRVLSALLSWVKRHGAAGVAALSSPDGGAAEPVLKAGIAAWEALREATGLDVAAAFDGARPGFADLAARLAEWAAEPDGLPLWLGWRQAVEAEPALAPLAAQLAAGTLAPEEAPEAFEHALAEALLAAATAAHPPLAAFDSAAMDRAVADFAEADSARIALARAEAAFAHAERLRAVVSGRVPGVEVLRGEMEKRRNHLPVRELLRRGREAVQAAKPVFLMSPLSVAQFLAPNEGPQFDLLVIDEASQVEPVDALGALARCRQIVVVGDDRQMPPTRFFQRITGEEEEGAEEAEEGPVAAREVESILGLANARSLPRAMLRWHYRSRHESLIATSNEQFYDNRLLVLPSPRGRTERLGLRLVRVPGAFDSGGSGTNRAEAEAVAQAILRHARETPGETLGVAAFSIRQRDAILDALERARRDSPETEPFFSAHPEEPFFVKNLENVQGDERDCIMISIGYAPDEEGRFAMRFGPLSAEGGERRLNVLITRAKSRLLVFSGIGAEDIDLSRTDSRGVAALKAFLAYAAAGGRAAAPVAEEEGGTLAGILAAEVQAAGKEAVRRVGLSGLFLDVAAKEGEDFTLGIETDGPDRSGIRCARDREKGRAAALSAMGWRLHRVWSLGWLARPEAEAARLRAALGAEAAAPEAAAVAGNAIASPYVEAALDVPRETPIPALSFGALAAILAGIVRVEGPVHRDAVFERARLLWGLPALSAEDRRALEQALSLAARLEGIVEQGGAWWPEDRVGRAEPRDRRGASAHLMRPAFLPAEEVAEAARRILAASPRLTEAELVRAILDALGLPATAEAAIAARVAALVGAGEIRPAG
ncbi:MAG: DUF4011 domain-containing protein [Acetobacteraceae bacterium]|nr:DUF4011 domain-containing protein [Acetobacteraceae bacterium]